MSARDELRGTLSNTICNASNYTKRAQPYLLGSDMSDVLDKTADAILAAGYRKPRIITTREQLAEEHMIVVRSDAGTISNIADGRAYFFGYQESVPVNMLKLPLTVLWEPEARP